MANKEMDSHADVLSSFFGKSSAGSLFLKPFKGLCEIVCPDCPDLSKREIEQILLEIPPLLASFSATSTCQKISSGPSPSTSKDMCLKVGGKLAFFLKGQNLLSESLVQICRLLEEIVADEIVKAGLDSDEQIGTVRCFFGGFEAALIDQLVQLETQVYKKKLREANRYILLERRRYYTIFSRMIEPAFIIDERMHIVDSNRAFNAFFGLKDKKHLGLLCYDVMGKDVCSACALEEMLSSNKSFSGVEAVIPVLGEKKTVLFSGTFLGDINNEFTGGIISVQDITYSKETEKALQESEEKYRTLIENVPDVTWRSDQNGNIVYISPNVERVCGYKPEEIIAAGVKGRYTLIHPQDVDRVRNDYGLFFASHLPSGTFLRNLLRQEKEVKGDSYIVDGQKKFDVKYRFQKKDGTWIWLHDRAHKIYQKEGVWYTDGVFSDISELKRAEDELEKHHFRMAELIDEKTAKLRQANRMLENEVRIRTLAEKELLELTEKLKISNRELEQFAHIASHDIKEPLILVLAFSERLLNAYSNVLDEKGRDYVVRLVKAAGQMKSLVDDLLELSRLSTRGFSVERVDLTNLVDEVVQNLEERISSVGGRVLIENLGSLDGDPVQLKQLFQNIIANALKYSKETHSPTVEIKQGRSNEKFIEIRVEDNGIGFDPSQAGHIFEPFTRLHADTKYEGTGIGLATCKRIVLRHGGEITAESSPGMGSSFIVRLPIKTGPKG